MYSPLTWLTTSEESQRTSSPVTPKVIAAQSPAKTSLYSASLLDSRKPKLKDCSMIDPFGVARTITIFAPLLFEAPWTFRTHPLSWLVCLVIPGVKSTMKSASTWPLIPILGSNKVVGSELRGPFWYPSCCFRVFHDGPQGVLDEDRDWDALKVVFELSQDDEEGQH